MKTTIITTVLITLSLLGFGQQTDSASSTKLHYIPDWILVEKDGLIGYITLSGEEIVKPKYEKIHPFGEYQEDWAMVEKDGYLGFISVDGKEIVKPKYDKIYPFGEYSEDWALVEKDGYWGFISLDGKEIVKPKYEIIVKDETLKGTIKDKVETITM